MACLNFGGFSISEGKRAAAWHPGTQCCAKWVQWMDGWLLFHGFSSFA